MRNFFLWIGGIVFVLVLVVLVAGKSAGDRFAHETTVIFDVNKDLLWDIVNDVDSYKKNKYGIVTLEKGEYIGNTIVSWKENYNFGVVKEYEVLRKKEKDILSVQVTNNFTRMNSLITFELSEDENKTYLKVTEASTLNNMFYKGLKVLAGRDAYINSEIKWIRVGLYNYLINK